ncbi:MAG TPA: hypothetical protein ENK86_01155 [Campylobacterales bacterium]|nr:hypothetical protein [Campylobacterales bacterium]
MKITAEEFDRRFDQGEDIFELMENPKIMKLDEFKKTFLKNSQEAQEQISLSFPKDFIQILDRKVQEIGVNREAFIKMIVAERLGVIGSD